MANLYTQAQCFTLAKGAGWDDKNAEIAAAIAITESTAFNTRGDVVYADFDKVGDISLMTAVWGASYGGWQVRSLKADSGKNTYRDAERLDEPQFNAWAAWTVWKNAGGKFTPWSTFTSGAYLGNMQHPKYNPVPSIPKGSYLVASGDYLSKIAAKTTNGQKDYPYKLVAAINRVPGPAYTIFPGNVILLPDWPYTVVSGDTLGKIAETYSEVTVERLATYNAMSDPNKLAVGQKLWIPRFTSWDGKTLVL